MALVIPDATTITQLESAWEVLEVRAPDGRVLGHFVPALNGTDPRWQPHISEEELQRRERQGGGRSLLDILSDLEKRP